jgi:hypothetical protein
MPSLQNREMGKGTRQSKGMTGKRKALRGDGEEGQKREEKIAVAWAPPSPPSPGNGPILSNGHQETDLASHSTRLLHLTSLTTAVGGHLAL